MIALSIFSVSSLFSGVFLIEKVFLKLHFKTLSNILNQSKEKFKLRSVSDDILSKFIFAHVNIFYCFGSIVLITFIPQVVLSPCLTPFYRSFVFETLNFIKVFIFRINFGWFTRSLQRWSLFFMILVIFLYIFRVFFIGNFLNLRSFSKFSRFSSSWL